jgi:hypothetical protein
VPTVFINGFAIVLPRVTKGGDIMTENDADVLNEVQHRRVKARLRWLLKRGEINSHDIQQKAEELCAMPMVAHSTLDDSDEDDPILAEAMNIARELISARMAAEGLPPPKGLDIHAKALVDALPEIQERARQRVAARYNAVARSLVNGADVI